MWVVEASQGRLPKSQGVDADQNIHPMTDRHFINPTSEIIHFISAEDFLQLSEAAHWSSLTT